MANPTTYFGWVMPTATDLVTDLPADFDVFGQGVDSSLQDLLGGTSGQVLSKNSNTNMDFTWTTIATGGMTLLSTTSLSGASTTISSISGSYNNLQIVIRDFLPSVDGASMYMRFNGDTGSNYVIGGTGFPSPAATTFAEIAAGIDNSVTENTVTVNLFDYANSATYKAGQFTGINNVYTGSNWVLDFGMLAYKSTTAISSVTIYPSSGTLTGTALIYGVK